MIVTTATGTWRVNPPTDTCEALEYKKLDTGSNSTSPWGCMHDAAKDNEAMCVSCLCPKCAAR